MSPVFERFVVPGNAQVELSAVDARTYPEWPTGAEAAVADASTVAIGDPTRNGRPGADQLSAKISVQL